MRGTELCRLYLTYDSLSRSKKNEFKPQLKKCWCIPPDHNAAFVAAMEDILAVYSRLYDKDYPVVCMDEKPVQFFASARKSIRSKDGRIEYEDNEAGSKFIIRRNTEAGWIWPKLSCQLLAVNA